MARPATSRALPPTRPSTFDIVVIGASSGGLAALSAVLGALPADFPAAIVVDQHRYGRGRNILADILRGRTPLHVTGARRGDRLSPATVYVTPAEADVCFSVSRRIRLVQGTRGGRARTSIDRLFSSAAEVFRARTLGVVLTGGGKDGAQGALNIMASRGTVLVQDPATAEAGGMPRAAIASAASALVLPLEKIGPTLAALVEGDTSMDLSRS